MRGLLLCLALAACVEAAEPAPAALCPDYMFGVIPCKLVDCDPTELWCPVPTDPEVPCFCVSAEGTDRWCLLPEPESP